MQKIGRWNSLEEIDHKLRVSVPIGSSTTLAKQYLGANHLEFSDAASSRTIYAIIRGIRGSFLIRKSASIRIGYDASARVRQIEVFASYL